MSSEPSHTVRTVDPTRLRRTLEGFRGLAWPVSRSRASELISTMGWQLLTSIDDPYVEADTRFGLNNILAMVDFENDVLVEVSFELADVVTEATLWRADALRDAFAQLVSFVRNELGKPDKQEPGEHPSATWEMSNGGRFFLSQGQSGVGASLSSREWADVNRAMGPMTASDWTAFADSLHATLRDLRARTFLIVSWTGGNVYVQFSQSDEALFAEAVGDDAAPPETELGIDAVESMNRAGWTPPEVQRIGNPNWTRTLPWPASSSACRDLAAACVLALQLRSVPTPNELKYRAWREREPMLPGITYDDDEVDRGEPDLELPSLGLARVQA